MRELTLQTDSIDNNRPGAWPWVIGAATLIALISSVNSDIKGIHNDLSLASRPIIEKYTSAHSHNSVNVSVNGRDLLLTGTINTKIARNDMIEELRSLIPIRVVRDELQEIDPQQHAQHAGQDFKRQLEEIDASSISFKPGSTSLASSNIPALDQLATLLRNGPERQIKITGHTDNSGNAQANLRISQQRAQSVSLALMEKGVQQNQLIVQGYGHTRPRG